MTVHTESLQQRLERIERERLDADTRYNEALTALDRAIGATPAELPHRPPSYEVARLEELNRDWNILPDGAPAVDRSLKGRLRGFIWRLIGPPLETQRRFNSALVDHLNRNVAVHEQSREATTSILELCAERIDALARFQAHLIQYLQTVTLYVDTRDRSAGAGVHVLNAAIDAVTDDFLKRWESITVRTSRLEAHVNQRVDQTLASVEDLRATALLAQQTALSLKRDVERLLGQATPATASSVSAAQPSITASVTPSVDLGSFKYLGFENEFRGPQDEIRRRLEAYLPLFEGRSDVLDIGCGRGEFLDLLRSRGVTAFGIDINDAMVEESRARGLSVEKSDALSYVTALPDRSIGGLFAAQVIEHLPPDYLSALLDVAALKIRPGGLIVLETINPACWVAFFESYIRDLTHVRPLHPDTMQYMLRASGFARVRVQFSSPVPEAGRLRAVAASDPDTAPAVVTLAETFNRNVELLNSRLFAAQDYAVIGEVDATQS